MPNDPASFSPGEIESLILKVNKGVPDSKGLLHELNFALQLYSKCKPNPRPSKSSLEKQLKESLKESKKLLHESQSALIFSVWALDDKDIKSFLTCQGFSEHDFDRSILLLKKIFDFFKYEEETILSFGQTNDVKTQMTWESILLYEYLPNIYKKYFKANCTVSRTSTCNSPSGPGLRFISEVSKKAGLTVSDYAIEKGLKRQKYIKQKHRT